MTSRRLRQGLASVRRFFGTGNLLRVLVALILAFGLWAWVTYQNDPEITRTLGGLPVVMTNLDEDLELVGDPPIVDVTIQGPQSIVAPLERESVAATVDMSDVEEAGSYDMDVLIDSPSGVRVRDVLPDTVQAEIDQIGSRSGIPVQITDPDDVPPNFQVVEIELESDEITVVGPVRSIQQVDHAELEIQIDGRTSGFTESIEPTLVDEDGNEVAGVQSQPEQLSVTVSLDVRGQVRTVIPVIVGDDALEPGYELVDTTVLPSDEVVVDGPDEDLTGVFFVTTEPVDVSGWSESTVVRDVELDQSRLPDSIELETETVHVSVEIRQQVHQRELSDVPIEAMNQPSGLDLDLAPAAATVILEGSRSAVETIDPDEVTVFVNLSGVEAGEHDLDLEIIVPPQVQYREIVPASVTVFLEDSDQDGDE